MLLRLAFAGLLIVSAPFAQAASLAIEYFHGGFGHFFVTAYPEEAAALDANPASGWARTGATFLVDTDAAQGAAPVCRFFSAAFAPKSSHFYTPYAKECENLKQGATWTFEAVAFYLRLPDAAGACAPGTEVLYRLYNEGMSGAPNHRYTTNRATFDALRAKGWVAEGHGDTGAFACTPARSVAPPAGNVTGAVELRAAVRMLPAAEAAELVSITDSALTFAAPVAIVTGDLFVVDGVGAFRATGVADIAGRRLVGVEAPTIDELFTKLDLKGSVPLAAGYFSEPGALEESGSAVAAGPRPRAFSVNGATYNGKPGVVMTWTYETHCGPGQKNMEPLTFSLGMYGDVGVDFSKGHRLQDAITISTAYFVPSAVLKVGCRAQIASRRFKVGQWSIPIFNGLAFIHIPIFLRFDLTTDVTPVVTVAFADVEYRVDPATGATSSAIRGGTIDTAALTSLLAPNLSYSATAGAQADASLRLVTLGNVHLAGVGLRTGPTLELKGTAGVESSVCGTLGMRTEIYYQYRTLQDRKLAERSLFKTDGELHKTGLGCTSANVPWLLTTRSCATVPQGCAECFPSFEYDFKFNSNRSSLDLLNPGTPNVAFRLDKPPAGTVPPPPDRYLGGCVNAEVSSTFVPACQLTLGLTFGPDYRSATFMATQAFVDGCVATLEGDARVK